MPIMITITTLLMTIATTTLSSRVPRVNYNNTDGGHLVELDRAVVTAEEDERVAARRRPVDQRRARPAERARLRRDGRALAAVCDVARRQGDRRRQVAPLAVHAPLLAARAALRGEGILP